MMKETVLVIDDNDEQRYAVQYILEKQGYLVLEAPDGSTGLKLLNEHEEITVLIVDLVMLDISGIEVLMAVKELKRPLRRIVLTAHDVELPFQKAKELGVFVYLNKPISKHTLLFTVKAAFKDLYLKQLEEDLGIAKQWEELGQIATDFAHIVGNKVGIVRNYIESIKDEMKSVPLSIRTKFEQINDIVQTVIDLKKGLLTPFKKTEKRAENLNEIIDISLTNFHFSKDIMTFISLDIKEPVVEVNTDEFEKVLENIFENAVEAMKESEIKKLTVKTFAGPNETAQIEIHDTGCGISDEHKSKIFRPFYSTKGSENFGFGLFSVKNTLAKFNGTIKFTNEEDGGTSFIIKLPLKKNEASKNAG